MSKISNRLFNNDEKPKHPKPVKGNVCIPIDEIRGVESAGRNFVIMLFILTVGLLPFVGKAAATKLSVLYIFGNDGKFSGRTSGDVYMRNGRKRAMAFFAPVRNAATLFVRSNFSTFSSGWNSLTNPQRLVWLSFKYYNVDVFARSFVVTGKQAYIGINSNMLNTQQTPLVDAPLGKVPPPATVVGILSATVGTLSQAYTLNPDGKKAIVWATGGLSAGTYKPDKNKFRIIGVVDTSAAGPADLFTAYVAKFGTPVVGTKIFVSFQCIGFTTGLPSQQSGSQTVVV